MEYPPFQESDHADDEGTFVTAPTSPIITTAGTTTPTAAAAAAAAAATEKEEEEEEEGSMALFYSLPSSPIKRTLRRNPSSFIIDDDFEFETSKKFRLESKKLEKTLTFIQQQQQHTNKNQNQNLVLPEIAFADELFSNGVVAVMSSSPLKLPPGRTTPLTNKNSPFSEIGGHPSCLGGVAVGGSPWRQTWKDGFDPFAAAIQKIVKEEVKKEETTDIVRVHRRAQSLCLPPGLILPHSSQKGSNPGLNLKERRHERTQSDYHSNPAVPSSPQKGVNGPNGLNWRVTSRKQGMGKFLRRYATFKIEKNEGKFKEQIASLWKSTSFKRLSFRFKESRHSRGYSQDEKAISNSQPKFAMCLGIGAGNTSPT